MHDFTPGSQAAWSGPLKLNQEERAIDVRTADGRAAPLVVTLSAPRNALTVADATGDAHGEAIIRWGSHQGSYQEAVVDIERGEAFPIVAAGLEVAIKNTGGFQHNPDRTERQFRAAVHVGVGGVGRATRAVRVENLATNVESDRAFVPAFAGAFSVPRFPQTACRVRFYAANNVQIAEYLVRREEDRRILVPQGADRVSVVNADATTLVRGQVQFELTLR